MPPKAERRPRIGVPWVSAAAEKAGKRRAYERYLRAVRDAGGEAVEVSLLLPNDELKRLTQSLDGVVLPGSASDINTRRYDKRRLPQTAEPDIKRERTDDFLLDYAFTAHKPVLAICYGAQILNVHLHGTLVQDIPSELHSPMEHDRRGDASGARHLVRIDGGSFATLASESLAAPAGGRLAELAAGATVRVNSSHHQSIRQPGRGLRVAACAPDGVIEAVEWIGGPEWIVGVQWHPERMRPGATASSSLVAQPSNHSGNGQSPDDGSALAAALFRKLIVEAGAVAKKS